MLGFFFPSLLLFSFLVNFSRVACHRQLLPGRDTSSLHSWREVPRASSGPTVPLLRTSEVEPGPPQLQTRSLSSPGGHFPPEGHRGPGAHRPCSRTLSLPIRKMTPGTHFLPTLPAPNKILISQRGVLLGKLSHIVKRKLLERGTQMTHAQMDEGLGWLVPRGWAPLDRRVA